MTEYEGKCLYEEKREYELKCVEYAKRILELEKQVEKMKCCFNCKHSRTEYEHCKTTKHEKCELAE